MYIDFYLFIFDNHEDLWSDTMLTQVDFHYGIESKHVIIWLLVKIIHDADKHPQGSINDIVALLTWIWVVWHHWTDIRQISVSSEENKSYLFRMKTLTNVLSFQMNRGRISNKFTEMKAYIIFTTQHFSN